MVDVENYIEFQDKVWEFVYEAQNLGYDADNLMDNLSEVNTGTPEERGYRQISITYDFLVDETKSDPDLTTKYLMALQEYKDLLPVPEQARPSPASPSNTISLHP